jgi:hypothetical protein
MGSVYKGNNLGGYGLELKSLLGKSTKLLRKDNPTPFYFKVTGLAVFSGKDEPTSWGLKGHDQEGENMEINIIDIDFIEVE